MRFFMKIMIMAKEFENLSGSTLSDEIAMKNEANAFH